MAIATARSMWATSPIARRDEPALYLTSEEALAQPGCRKAQADQRLGKRDENFVDETRQPGNYNITIFFRTTFGT